MSQNDTFDHRLMETLFLLKRVTYFETSTSQLHDNMNFAMSNKFYDTLYTLEIEKLTIFGLMVYKLVTIIMKKITNIIIREHLTIKITGWGIIHLSKENDTYDKVLQNIKIPKRYQSIIKLHVLQVLVVKSISLDLKV